MLLLLFPRSGPQQLNGTADDSLASITEAATRSQVLSRSAGDEISTLSESVLADKLDMIRTVDDSISSMSESVARGSIAYTRSASDSVSSISESVQATKQGTGRSFAVIIS